MVPYLLEKGMPLADARDYAISNCMSWVIPGKAMVYRQGMGMFSFTNCMMLALNQGVDWLSGQKAGYPTPDPLTYKSIDDIIEATMQQFNFYLETSTTSPMPCTRSTCRGRSSRPCLTSASRGARTSGITTTSTATTSCPPG
jgi:pyruvate-formate lyase